MKIVFRVDASLEIGTGHVMRCLTLADGLSVRGMECSFICCACEGNLIEFIRGKGHAVYEMPPDIKLDGGSRISYEVKMDAKLSHSHWLGTTQTQDAEKCIQILTAQHQAPDWLIVDHYSLDTLWERMLKSYCRGLMVIDDLADRHHFCDILVDQTFGREDTDYHPLVTEGTQLLCGSKYALIRPEFARLRQYSLDRRARPTLRELLITMGGVDKDNVTGKVMEALSNCFLPPKSHITVVMGPTAPWVGLVREQARNMPWPTRVLAGVDNIAILMADSDLVVGAGGGTSWERCCLGLPTIMIVLAENQRQIAGALSEAGAVHLVDASKLKNQPLITPEVIAPKALSAFSDAAAGITDGFGVSRVINYIIDKGEYPH